MRSFGKSKCKKEETGGGGGGSEGRERITKSFYTNKGMCERKRERERKKTNQLLHALVPSFYQHIW